MSVIVRLQAEIFDPGAETSAFLKATANKDAAQGIGAMVTFTGLVRSPPGAPIISLTLEHYPLLAKAQLTRFAQTAMDRFDLLALGIIHRFGEMKPGEPIVQVMSLAPHRRAAFDGAEFVMDFLKTDAPFWKEERRETGQSWVAAKSDDDIARARWR